MANNFSVLTGSKLTTTPTRDDIYTLVETINPTSTVTDGLTMGVSNDKFQVDVSVPRWFKVTAAITHTAFQTAATTNTVTILTLPAGGIIQGVKIKHSTAYAGTGITAYTVSVGISGDASKYATAFDVLQATGDTTFQISTGAFSEDHGNSTAVIATATSTGANLDQSTAGDMDIWILYSAAV